MGNSAGRPRKKARAQVVSQEETALLQTVTEQPPDPGAVEEPEAVAPPEAGVEAVLLNVVNEGQTTAASSSTGGIPRLCCPSGEPR